MKRESESISESFLTKQKLLKEDPIYSEIDLSELETEIELISDPNIKKFVRYLLKHAPGFWKAPASKEIGEHPPDEELEGGLVIHTKRVVRVAMLLSMTVESESQTEFDCFVAAALLHDISRFVLEENTKEFIYDPMHPYTVDRYVEWARRESLSKLDSNEDNAIDIDTDALELILRLIRCSHGIWSPIPETVPISALERALHEADLIASNLHGIIDGLDVEKTRWLK
jgi:hypothetical protein